MNEFEILGRTMNALQKEKQRQEREHNRQRQTWQRQISYQQRQQRRVAELEANKSLFEGEIEKLSKLAQNAQGPEAEQLELLLQKRQLEIMEIDQELSGVQSFGRGWLRLQIEQLDNRIETLEEMLQTQEQMYLESQMKQMEEEKLREEAERLVNLKQELEQKYPPDVAQQILTEMRRLQAVKMAQKNYYNP
jgi:hypothetical protein